MKDDEPLRWLYGREAMGIKLGLGNITRLLSHLGDPHLRFRSVHVAGSNGKGSVSAMTASVLQEAGYRTGLYTSPHLVDFRERIQVDGASIPEKDMLHLIDEVREFAERPGPPEERLTFFELTTAMAFAHFADAGVDEAVVEVGMGGRLDATNVITPDCCAITRIGLEHTMYLGDTIAAIASEKAGIIKPGVPVVTIEQDSDALSVIRARAGDLEAPLKIVGRDVGFEELFSTMDGTEVYLEELDLALRVPLLGRYQASNCALAGGTLAELMRRGIYIPEEAIINGMAKVRWPGRMDIVSHEPLIMFDVTHTPDGARTVAAEVGRLLGSGLILVLGVLSDKDLQGIAASFGPLARLAIATSPSSPRAFMASQVAQALRPFVGTVEEVPDVAAALTRAVALASPMDSILVTGSLFTIGEAFRWLDDRKTRR
jgi:dihydrofolate synthase/folylpolyglutamate synthase